MDIIGKVVVGSVIVMFSSVLNGYVLSILWDWFIVLKFGLASLSIPEAIGLSLTIGFLTFKADKNDDTQDDFAKIMIRGISICIGKAIVGLSGGYVITLFL